MAAVRRTSDLPTTLGLLGTAALEAVHTSTLVVPELRPGLQRLCGRSLPELHC